MHKLLVVNVTANWGSTGRICEDICQHASSRGWDAKMAFGRHCASTFKNVIRIGSSVEVYEHFIENRLFDNEGLASRYATLRFIQAIKHIKPDVIHLHNIHDHYLNYRLLFKYLNNTPIKVIYTFHDFWAVTGHCYHFVRANCDKWKTECGNCPINKSLIRRTKQNFRLKKKLFSENDNLVITAVSEWVASLVHDSFLKDKLIRVIPNGIDTTVFTPVDYSSFIEHNKLTYLLEGKFVILGVSSRWDQSGKGFDDYMRLSELLDEDEIILLVGVDGKTENLLPHNVIGAHRSNSKEDLASLYSRADVVLSLSEAETFGLTIIEGFACGTPAVVYNNTAPPSLITAKTGFVANNHDVADVYRKIKIIKGNGKGYYSKPCIELARNQFDNNVIIDKYFDLYEEVLHN